MTVSKSNLQGVGYIILTIFLFSLQGLAVKFLGDDYPILEIVIIRSLVGLPFVLLFFRIEGNLGIPTTQHLKLEVLRSSLLFMSYICAFMGLAALPLAEVAAIRNSGPLMITLLSVLILDEKVGPRRWGAMIVGFLGVLMIVRPGSTTFNLGSVLTLLSVLFYALSIMVTRKLKSADSSATMAYYSAVVFLFLGVILAPAAAAVGEIPGAHPSIAFLFHPWAAPTLIDWGIIAGLGVIWAPAMYFVAQAYSLAQASVVSPFEYLSLPINVIWDLVIWQITPSILSWVGAFLTIFSGLYVLSREQKNSRKLGEDLEPFLVQVTGNQELDQ